ncbi:MAG TPA: hypothetical protein VJ690_09850 [Burkholderiales bacterium]|nr:hypothetical protein [Burkholderiales bacterium]
MDLSTTIASTAIVLAVILTAGYAFGEAASEPTQEQTIEAREVQRNIADEGDCETPNKTDEEHLACQDGL